MDSTGQTKTPAPAHSRHRNKMYCQWEKLGEKFQCPACGTVQGHSALRTCGPREKLGALPPAPELDEDEIDHAVRFLGYSLVDVKNWASAIKRWIAAGKPVRTDEEVAAIFAICESNRCGFWDAKSERCKECGCNVNLSTFAPKNKSRMKTEVCPKGLWR